MEMETGTAAASDMDILEQLKRDEGRRPRAYQDTQGIWTVGYGHNLTSGPPLSEDAMTQILKDDLLAVDTRVRSIRLWHDLSPARKGVLLNLAFNMGFDGLMGFRDMLDALETGNWERAAGELLDSRYARQVGARADRLAKQLLEDAWV
jgi:lysozyme